jgi:hypothetical protein
MQVQKLPSRKLQKLQIVEKFKLVPSSAQSLKLLPCSTNFKEKLRAKNSL